MQDTVREMERSVEEKVQERVRELEEVNGKQQESYEQTMTLKKEEVRLLHEENLQLHNQLTKKDHEMDKLMRRVAEAQEKTEQLN